MAAADESNRFTLLVVEDQDDTAGLLRFILERAGHFVTHVAEGRTAWDLIVTAAPPDSLLLNIVLPCVTGLTLLRVIRTTPEWQWISVILVSVYTQPETVSEAFDLEATEYLKKPFSAERVMKSVNRFLSSSKAAASEEARRTLRYVEPLSDARTPLADFFSFLRGICASD